MRVIGNPTTSISHDRGPLIAKTLAATKVQMCNFRVLPRALAMLKEFGIAKEITSLDRR